MKAIKIMQHNSKHERGSKVAKLTKLEQAAVDMLPEIEAATQAGSYVFKSAFDVAYLVENGLAEQNEAIRNPNSETEEFATRITDFGISTLKAVEETKMEQPAPAEIKVEEPKPERKSKMSFVIENIPVVAGKRGCGTRAAKYPFADLEVGQSFFVATDKSIASALTNAMKAYDVPLLDEAGVQKTKEITVPKTGEKRTILATSHVRVFKAVAETVEGVKGFRVGRTA